MNELEAVSHGTFLRSKQTVTVAINFLNWLHDREIPLEDLQQADVDDWVRDGPTTRFIADRFLNWAMGNRIAPSGLKVPRHRVVHRRPHGHRRRPAADRWQPVAGD